MADGCKVHIDKLDVENYMTWISNIKFFLTSKDLWNGVEDPVAHPAQSNKALSIIGLNVEDHHLGSIEECKTAKEAWDLLEKTYKSKTNTTKMQLRQELRSLKMKSGGKEKGHGKDESRSKGPKCYNCGEYGHIARKCSKPDRREHKPEQKKGGKPPKGVAFSNIEGVSTDEWLVDSGSSQHLTEDKSLFETLEMFGGSGQEFTFGDNGTLWAEGSGSVELRGATPTGESLEDEKCELEVDGEVVLVARKVTRVYVVNRAEKETCFLVKEPETAELWHRRLGHAGYKNLAKMVQRDLVEKERVKPKKRGGQDHRAHDQPVGVAIGKQLKSVRTDRGKEYFNKVLEEAFGGKGTIHEKTAPYSAEQIGTAERLNRVLEEKTRPMLEDSGLAEELWAEAVVTANHTRNRTPPDSKAYRLLRDRAGKLIISRDVIHFDEGIGEDGVVELGSDPTDGSQTAEGPGAQVHTEAHEGLKVESLREGDAARARPTTRGRRARFHKRAKMRASLKLCARPAEPEQIEEDIGRQKPAAQRYPARERRASGEWYRANLAAEPKAGEHLKGTGKHLDLQSYQEAIGGEESELWRKSMDEEMRSLLENGTGELVKKSEGVKPVLIKSVYKIKRDALGNVERYKSRLVAKGYLQKQGTDFEEVYVPVSKHTTLRALLAVVAERDLELHQLDVKTAFLNEEQEEEIYMQQPQGYEQGGPNMVCHLKRTMYGLRRAPHAWYMRLNEELGNFEFVASMADAALFKEIVAGERVYLVVWVDDILVAGRTALPNECVGSMLYLSVCTRPDIAQAVGALARFMARPTEEHWRATLGVVRYLAGTGEDGVTFGGSGETLIAYCDADYVGDVDTMRSTTGLGF
ncbi:putative retrotransposon protein [Klebsormidium nitens]|uniref:Putative retrotransposon protein n=1 Tax=Klebsormidium nitens TaxID=105231 RepID=A0A1Y1IS30_KLENI|nr:putative retrotransposon protein [Klebsormidium nitens]|eukprot:GAQ92061.1 putative retrotransposon protein [Klebsormidium nitens]